MGIALDQIRAGDFLLYRGNGPASWVIKALTASRYTHIEQYDGRGQSWASRDGIGVGLYDARTNDLSLVLRVRTEMVPFDMAGARRYWASANGRGYDWCGLAVSRFPSLQGGVDEEEKEFCSEAATRAFRFGIAEALGLRLPTRNGSRQAREVLARLGRDPFNGENADAIFPGMFPRCAFLEEVTA